MAKGAQKEARLRRLREEILNFVSVNPGCTASQIVAWLSIDLKMKNHGFDTAKGWLFHPKILQRIGLEAGFIDWKTGLYQHCMNRSD